MKTRHTITIKGEAGKIDMTASDLSTLKMSPEMIVINLPELVSVSDLFES